MEDVKKYQGWTILVDCDGVLTDGKKYVDSTGGRQLIAFHSRDSIACKALVEMGFQVVIITASSFKGIWEYWKKYGAEVHSTRGSKIVELEKYAKIEDWTKTIGIGDDITDDCFLEKCKYPYLVADHHPFYKVQESVTHYAHTKHPTLDCNGGEGALAAIWSKINNNLI